MLKKKHDLTLLVGSIALLAAAVFSIMAFGAMYCGQNSFFLFSGIAAMCFALISAIMLISARRIFVAEMLRRELQDK